MLSEVWLDPITSGICVKNPESCLSLRPYWEKGVIRMWGGGMWEGVEGEGDRGEGKYLIGMPAA